MTKKEIKEVRKNLGLNQDLRVRLNVPTDYIEEYLKANLGRSNPFLVKQVLGILRADD